MKLQDALLAKDISLFRPQSIELDVKYRAFIKDKRVAIVGRGGIFDLKQGQFIDAHDVVVRVHAAVPYVPNKSHHAQHGDDCNNPVVVGKFVPDEWVEIVGARTDVIYCKIRNSTFTDDRNKYIQRWLEVLKRSGAKFFCRDVMTNQTHHEHAHLVNYVPMRYPSWELRDWISCQIEEGLVEAGVMAIADILVQKPASVYATGFPCCLDYKIIPGMDSEFGHQRIGNLMFLRSLYVKGLITCDGRMLKLFEMYAKD